MGLTLLPDMEEKRKKKTARNEKRKRHNVEKSFMRRKKCLAKRKSFASIYAKSLAVILIIGAVITTAITILVEKNEHNKMISRYNQWKNGIYNTFDDVELMTAKGEYTDEELLSILRGRLKSAMINYNYSSWFDFSAAVYDIDTLSDPSSENIIYGSAESEKHIVNNRVGLFCDSGEAVCFVSYKQGKLEKIYECPKEAFGSLYDDIIDWQVYSYKHYEDKKSVIIEDYYVKGDEVIPGTVTVSDIGESGYALSSTRKVYDFSPSEKAGYTHYNAYEEEKKRINGEDAFVLNYIFGGTRAGSPAYNDTRLAEVNYYDDGAWGVSWGNDKQAYKYRWDNLEENNYGVGEPDLEVLGKKFAVVTSGYFFFYKYYASLLIKIYIIEFIALLLLAFFIARYNWLKIKTQYEIDEYRKTITDSMAHDLKSPLMAISAMAENLKENVHTEKKDYYVNAIAENVSYMNRLIENILDLSRLENSCCKPEQEKLDMNELTISVLDKYTSIIADKNIKITHNIDLIIDGNRQLMEQAIDNLIFNAVKYTEDGGCVEIGTLRRSFTIINDCQAADKLDVHNLVKPFTKADRSRSNKSGSGIGLAIVKNILAEHGYKLILETKPDKFIATIQF